ncbi:MAG TPA: TonB-dependent receptor [Terriglobales bacterium]|nr:TonB-dependent receptor [Terriglobales bacterium]
MRQSVLKLIAFAFLLAMPFLMSAQDVASVTGVVTDTTGAVVEGVSVTLLNTRTNTKYESTTNETGLYLIPKVQPGPGYKITFQRNGFETVVINDLYLIVASTRTLNTQMKVGAVSETVEVSAAAEGVALNTTDATVGSNFNMNAVAQLPVQIRDSPAALLQLQPGVVNATGGSDGLSSRAGSVTGARGDQNNVTLDGLDVNDFATGQAFSTVSNAPVESIQEFRGETAGSLSASGRGSGGQVSLLTKSGTNVFHGSLFEYHRNTLFAANNWFNNLAGVQRPKLIRNQFGGTIGGPVVKDKLFFFFNYNGRRDARSASVTTTVPLDSFRAGTIHYIKNTAGCTASSRLNTNPECIGTLSPAQVAALDPQGVGANTALMQFLNSRYPQANDLTGGDGLNTGGYRFNSPVNRTANDYVTKIDYNLNNSMKLSGRFSILRDRYGDSVNYAAPVRFPGDPMTKTIENTSYSFVINHNWTISPTMVNQFTYGKTVSQLAFPTNWNPNGTNYWQVGGSLLTNPYYNQSNQQRKNPIPVFRDDFSWQKGNHNIQFGGTFKPILTTSTLVNDNNFPLMGLGGNLTSLLPSLRPEDALEDANEIATTKYDAAFAFLLGHMASVGSNYNYNSSLSPLPQGSGATRQYRYYETELYGQDTWKVNSALTLTFGLRYQHYSVPYEVNGIQAIQNVGFDELVFGRAANGLAGRSGYGVEPITSYDLGGKANNARDLYNGNFKDFAPRFSFAYSPSPSTSWLNRVFGDRKTVLRGGAGLMYDHTVTNALNFIQDQNSYMFQAASSVQYEGDATLALLNDPRFTNINTIPTPGAAPTIDRPFAPFVDADGIPFGNAAGEFNYAIDSNLKTPYSIVLNFGFQRELPGHFVLESTYVGRLGRRLIAQADAAQLVDFKDPVSGQMLSEAFAALTGELRAGKNYRTVTRQPFFENQVGPYGVLSSGTQVIAGYQRSLTTRGDVADVVQWLNAVGIIDPNVGVPAQFAGNTYITNKGNSNYHGLLTSLHKNMSNGLQFDLNYTFSHSIDNASGIANSISASSGMGFICDALNLRTCRGNSDFDITHIVNGNFIYELPFGKGKSYGSSVSKGWNQLIGGWTISGIPTWRSGIAWSTITGAYLMGYANNAPAIWNGDTTASRVRVHTTSQGIVNLFAFPAEAYSAFTSPIGFQIGSRNNLRGPSFFNLDLGVAKTFPINERFGLNFRADAFNALNHASFGLPGGGSNGAGANLSSGAQQFGRITSTSSTAREMQFALRLEF